MAKTLLYAAFALCLSTQVASAQQFDLETFTKAQQTMANASANNLNVQAMQSFLNTSVGKNFSASQVKQAFANGSIQVQAPKKETANTTVINENFNSLTKGTPDAPDADEMDETTASSLLPGWTVWHVHQAGGTAYLGYVDTDNGDPGYLMTPDLDLTGGQGVYKVTFRAKNVNPDNMDQGLQYFVLDNVSSSAMLASTLPLSNSEFTEVSFTGSGGTAKTAIMFFGWKGKVLIDSMVVEQIVYSLNTPQNISIGAKDGSTLGIRWDAVEGATSYVVKVYNYTDEYTLDDEPVAEVNVNTNEANVKCDFNAEYGVYVTVVAKNADSESYRGTAYTHDLDVENIDAPKALEATNVTTNGFTANWELSTNAHNYLLNLVRTHEATEDGETAVIMDDDFDEITTSLDDAASTLMNTSGDYSISFDDYINYPGWYTYLIGVAAKSVIGITNMYESLGIHGVLISPKGDYSLGSGKYSVSGSAFSYTDDVVMKVGFGSYTPGLGASFNDGAQQFTIKASPMEMKGTEFNVEVSGGTKESQLIFLITDADEEGDMAIFDKLKITTSLKKGEQVSANYAMVTLPYDATSYNVEVPFTGNDKFEYTVTGTFGSKASEKSNTIVVNAPNTDGISNVSTNASQESITVYAVDGKQVISNANSSVLDNLHNGMYIVRQGNKTYKVAK